MLDNENANNVAEKHVRLISDYKSLRDKHNLLKNALILEREKLKKFEVLISESDMAKRKLLQEQESLIFRNDLLTKQINSLRDELDRERQRKSKKVSIIKGNDISPTKEELEVIKEELINKISECSTLHSQISNLNFDYQMETNNFRSAINDLENQLKQVKEQNNITETNLRKTLTNEIEERTFLENKLENKDNLITKLENSKQDLKAEIKELRLQLSSRSINHPSTLDVQRYGKVEGSDVDSVKSKDATDSKKCASTINSLASSPSDANLSSNEIYIYSLLDKIGQLELKVNNLELSNQITEKRLRIEKSLRDHYETFLVQKGLELPPMQDKRDGKFPSSEEERPNSIYEAMSKFYECKFLDLNKQIYQAIAKASLYFDETRSLGYRLESEKVERDHSRKEIDSLKDQIRTSQEDLEITRTQYDNKMRTMSIHIAELTSQMESDKQHHGYGDHVGRGPESVSSIKNFINSLKK